MFIDPILQSLEKNYPPPSWTDRSEFLFEDLIDTVISQQLSGKAAASIFNRFKEIFHTPVDKHVALTVPIQTQNEIPQISNSFPTPQQVLSLPHETSGVSASPMPKLPIFIMSQKHLSQDKSL